MVSFKRCAIIQYFVMICCTISIINAGAKEDYKECMRQIYYAFGKSSSSTGCFKYAIEFYTKEEGVPNKSQNVVDKSQNVDNDQNVQNHSQNAASSSRRHVSKPHIQVYSFDQLFSSGQPEASVGVNTVKTQLPNAKRNIPTEVFNFEDLISNVQADEHQNVSTNHENVSSQQNNVSSHQNVSTEHTNIKNYANAYYEQLQQMIQAGGVDKPSDFCDNYYQWDYVRCINNLVPFGKNAKAAVGVALTVYKLLDCGFNYYMYHYMSFIIDRIHITNPSKRPQKFCLESVNEWVDVSKIDYKE